MKHEVLVTNLLISIFVLSQLVGLFLLALDVDVYITNDGYRVSYEDTAIGERPDFEGVGSLLYLTLGIAAGTVAILFLIKLKLGHKIWKLWYALAVGVSIMLTLGVVMSPKFAFVLAVFLTYMKMYRSNMVTHNVTELLMYAGLAILLVPIFDVFWASIMLIIISIYDAIAVWKSKHMIDLAKFTTESNLFAGLLVNYKAEKGKTAIILNHRKKEATTKTATKTVAKKTTKKNSARQAILGGGDIVFPLLFTGTILNWLLQLGYTKQSAFGLSLIVTLGATSALTYLFITAKRDKFYPAMPFISAGCFLGFIILLTVVAFI